MLLPHSVGLHVPRARHKRRVAESVQQMVHGAQLPQHAELFPQDSLDIFAAERADFVGGRRTGCQSRVKLFLLRDRQGTRTTAAGTIFQARQALGVEASQPVLYLATTQT